MKEILDQYGDGIMAFIGAILIIGVNIFLFFSSSSPFSGVISNFLPF